MRSCIFLYISRLVYFEKFYSYRSVYIHIDLIKLLRVGGGVDTQTSRGQWISDSTYMVSGIKIKIKIKTAKNSSIILFRQRDNAHVRTYHSEVGSKMRACCLSSASPSLN